MLHLLQRTVSPAFRLQKSVEDWYDTSRLLREAPRKRRLKIAEIQC